MQLLIHDRPLSFLCSEAPFSHVGGPGLWVPAEGVYGVLSPRPTLIPYKADISPISICCHRGHSLGTLAYTTQDSWASGISGQPLLSRGEASVASCRPLGRGHFLAVVAGLCRVCVSVCACHPLPAASHSWFVTVFVVQGKRPC